MSFPMPYQNKEAQFFARRTKLKGEKAGSDKHKTVVLPLCVYDDAFATNNLLGSHKDIANCGAVYCSIPALPPEMQLKVENIFLLGKYIFFASRKYVLRYCSAENVECN